MTMKAWYHGIMALTGVVLLLLAGCKPSVPSEYISPDELEDLLYDYHLADAMAQQAPGDYAQNTIAYREAVLKKYHVSQADFDSSMVYYMRHANVLHGIYENIAKRLEDDVKAMGGTGGAIAISGNNLSGDTADIWRGPRSLALLPVVPYNSHSFILKADTSIHRGDAFLLSFRSDFIFQDGSRDGVALLSIVFGNDSTASQVLHLSSPQQTTVSVDDRDSLGIKEVKGFFMLNKSQLDGGSSTTLQLMSISNIKLWRIHRKGNASKPVQPGQPVRPDLPAPSAPAPRHRDSAQQVAPALSSPDERQRISSAPDGRLQMRKREMMTR